MANRWGTVEKVADFIFLGCKIAADGDFSHEIKRRLGFPCGAAGKESACNVGDLGLIPGLGRSPGERKGYPLQYSGLENSMDYTVHGVTKSQTRLSDFLLTPWKESYDQPRQHIKKQRHTLLTKVRLVKAMVFPVVMHGCESWTVNKAEPEELMLLNCGVGEDS